MTKKLNVASFAINDIANNQGNIDNDKLNIALESNNIDVDDIVSIQLYNNKDHLGIFYKSD